VPGACAKRTDPFDDGTGEVLLVELVVPGHSKTPHQVPCAQDGFDIDIPDGATEIELLIGLYPATGRRPAHRSCPTRSRAGSARSPRPSPPTAAISISARWCSSNCRPELKLAVTRR